MDISLLEVKDENIKMAVLANYYQSTCLYILRKDGVVVSTDNLNGFYSITNEGLDFTEEFIELFSVDTDEFSEEEFNEYQEQVQNFLNSTQSLNRLSDPEELSIFIHELNDPEALLVIRHADCI